MTRAESAARVARLHSEGLNGIQIAERLGISRAYSYELLSDPDGSVVRARKASYGGECIDCGGLTDGSNGPSGACERCLTCDHAHRRSLEGRRAQSARSAGLNKWSDEELLAALRQVARNGRLTPLKYDAVSPELGLPSRATIHRRFESWNEAKRRAGLIPGPPHKPYRTSITAEDCVSTVVRCTREMGRLPLRDEYRDWSSGTNAPCDRTVHDKCGWIPAIEQAALQLEAVAA